MLCQVECYKAVIFYLHRTRLLVTGDVHQRQKPIRNANTEKNIYFFSVQGLNPETRRDQLVRIKTPHPTRYSTRASITSIISDQLYD